MDIKKKVKEEQQIYIGIICFIVIAIFLSFLKWTFPKVVKYKKLTKQVTKNRQEFMKRKIMVEEVHKIELGMGRMEARTKSFSKIAFLRRSEEHTSELQSH